MTLPVDTACSCAESLPIEIVARFQKRREDRRCQRQRLVARLSSYTNQRRYAEHVLGLLHQYMYIKHTSAIQLMKGRPLFGNHPLIKTRNTQLWVIREPVPRL